jgi:hypothetical protein
LEDKKKEYFRLLPMIVSYQHRPDSRHKRNRRPYPAVSPKSFFGMDQYRSRERDEQKNGGNESKGSRHQTHQYMINHLVI